MKEINLTKGYVTQVDDDLYDWLSQYKWWASVGHNVYARALINGKQVKMHRLIMGAGDGEQVDHINHNTLCNLRENLRKCTPMENARNKRSARGSSSKYVGVSRVEVRQKNSDGVYDDWYWRAFICVNNKHRVLISTKDEVQAAMVRDVAALKYYGEFAHLNFPEHRKSYMDGSLPLRLTGGSSNYKGVYLEKNTRKWRAHMKHNGEEVNIGSFNNEIEAAMAIDIVSLELCGDGAKLNFPERIDEYRGQSLSSIRKEIKKHQASQFRGVYWKPDRGKWLAKLIYKMKTYHCGYYLDENDAAAAYDRKSMELFNGKGYLNFPEKINEYLCVANGTKKVLV